MWRRVVSRNHDICGFNTSYKQEQLQEKYPSSIIFYFAISSLRCRYSILRINKMKIKALYKVIESLTNLWFTLQRPPTIWVFKFHKRIPSTHLYDVVFLQQWTASWCKRTIGRMVLKSRCSVGRFCRLLESRFLMQLLFLFGYFDMVDVSAIVT